MRTVRTESARASGHEVRAVRGLRVLLLLGASLLGACGYFGGRHTAPGAHPEAKAQAAPSDPNAKALAGMVAAVGPSRGQPPLELLFAIRKRPEVGVEDTVDYALVPRAPGLGTVRLVFGSVDGLQVTGQDPPAAAIKAVFGVPILGSVTVQPLKTGLFTLTAEMAVASSPTRVVVWPFSIPVIVGEGPAQTAASQP